MSTVIYIQTDKGEQHKIELFEAGPSQALDKVLDQLNKGSDIKYITEAEFHLDDPMILDIVEDEQGVKVGEVTTRRIKIGI